MHGPATTVTRSPMRQKAGSRHSLGLPGARAAPFTDLECYH